MRIAITSHGPKLTSPVDPRFGRAACFVVVDTDTGEVTSEDNTANLNAVQGAGVQAGKKVVDLGVEGVVTGHIGPKAFGVLRAAGVAVYTGATGTVADVVDCFRAGQLQPCAKPDVDGHWT